MAIMGSQTLEILRQGVWASLTGGWFYDPHEDLFCNTVHLYIWLFLLCVPFSVYLYFPPASVGWIIYCTLVALLFIGLKILNHALHRLYDTHEIFTEPQRPLEPIKIAADSMEMKMMRDTAPGGGSDDESVTSLEYHKPNNSTIDLKVDVHRKNSSESSMEDSAASGKHVEPTGVTKSDLCIAQSSEATNKSRPGRRPKSNHKRDHRKTRRLPSSRIDELTAEEIVRNLKTEDSLSKVDEGPYPKVSSRYQDCAYLRSNNRDFFKEWLYLDGNEAVSERFKSDFARQLSLDPRESSEPNVGPLSPKKKIAQRRRYTNYPDESCTKSAMALATAQSSNMRRNSNSTMSTIQLPLLNSTAQLVSHMRRHSNNTEPGFFASVELGAYMMDKNDQPPESDSKCKGKSPGVRRIKSTALEICCPPPSVSNLSPHPNSAETIGGQVLKNPKNSVIPPPSKCLTRGPHLNLCPKNETGEGCSYPYLNYGSEIVYPIAEISDEMQTSQKETDLDSSGDSYSDYDEENNCMRFRGFDWDSGQQAARSSDSDYENNGSRSPLLDRLPDIKVVRSKTQDKKTCDKQNTKQTDNTDKPKSVRLKKQKSETQSETKNKKKDVSVKDNNKLSHNFDKTSATSKDLLIEKSSLESTENQTHKETDKKPWDQEISNSSTSIECHDKEEKPAATENEESQIDIKEESSDYSLNWLFGEDGSSAEVQNAQTGDKTDTALGETSTNIPKNLGAIPKQMKNIRSRTSSQKENKKKEFKKENNENQNEEMTLLDAVEAEAALVQGLECLFAATNANTVVMPNQNREERQRHRQHSIRGDRDNSNKARKRSIEEVAQTSTSTLLPTTMPLLAAFLSSRTDLPPFTTQPTVEIDPITPTEEPVRYRGPLMDRNHRNRVRKIKRSTRQRNQTQNKERQNENCDSPNVHFATSFDDTSEGATHCFLDEHGNLMSYTFDKNNIGRVQALPMPLPNENPKQPILEKTDSQDTTGDGSCASLESETGNENSKKRTDSIDQSSSNQGSNNPLIESSNNLSMVVPINVNTSNNSKRFYVFDGGTNSDQPRSPVAYATDSLLEQIEAERQNRMGFPSMHINYIMNQQRAQRELQQSEPTTPAPNYGGLGSMPVIGEENYDQNARINFQKLLDDIQERKAPKPKSYYKIKLFKCWDIKIELDRLKLMAMFDRNLCYKETFASVLLAVLVAVLGSMVLNLGFYRDIYAFWFCFIMAGSQYCLLKSVQPDASSPVHGFNKMVVFSRATYFCLCTAILVTVHTHLENSTPLEDIHDRNKRSISTEKPFTVYGIEINEKSFLYVIQEIISKFLLFFPIAFSLGLFPQVNTFLMYLLEQIDMHIFGGNATRSLSAALYCVLRSIAAVAVLYGFAYSGLVEGKKSQHQKHNILLSIFCALLVPIAYHLSRSASDYSVMWNLIKKHLLPPELFVIHNPECSQALGKTEPTALSEENKKSSDSNISKQNSLGSSVSKVNFSSETNIARTHKKSQTSSVNSLKLEPKVDANVCNPSSKGDANVSNPSLKEPITESDDKSQEKRKTDDGDEEEMEDPLPKKLQATVNARLKNDLIVCTFLALFVFGIHCTTVFSTLRPQLNTVLWIIACIVGWLVHYVLPQLRKQQPWLCLAGPVFKAREHKQFEMSSLPAIVFFEKIYVYVSFLERNVLYPAIIISATTQDAPAIADKYGDAVGALIIAVCALKCLRNAYSETESQYLIVVFAVLLFQHDLLSRHVSETFLVDYFVTAIIFSKVYEFLLKIQFVVTYIAPWQITWGSAFHAFAQPFSVPHSAMLFVQAAISAAISSPLTPAIGSAIFMTSYVRPVKFWERDYNTNRVDSTNTRLSSQLDRNLGADDNNLNSIFYEHLTRSLQHYLCGDLMLGRWGQVQQGDCFVLASDYLNCLVHVVEVGNGLVSFQLRGLEFRGTYCQQREVEAISEGPDETSGWWVGGALLSPGWMFSLRWLSWQLVCTRYVVEGYSVSDNSAASMLQVFDFRKLLLTYYVKSIIYYTIRSPKLDEWLSSLVLQEALKPMAERNFVDLDPIFNVNLDEDYDFRASGITRSRFWAVYGEWTSWVWSRTGGGGGTGSGSGSGRSRGGVSADRPVVSLVFALSLLGRRALAKGHHLSASSVEFFLYGLHSLFKGDFRITCARDEWVFTDMSLLHSVLAPAIRMALKLHQDHFMFPDEYSSSSALYSAICTHGERLVICHETQPAWRYHVLRGAPHLLALRHVMDEGSDDYKIIMLNKRYLTFRVIRLNRECVRGLWAGQQQELVYLRNRNPERGSIQNAKQALRNIINSSCDQPIGYPIYVSPLTTSYVDTSDQLTSLLGGPLTASHLLHLATQLWRRIRVRCGEGCSSGGECPPPPPAPTLHLSRTSLAGTRGSVASGGKPTSTLASLASLLRDHSHDRPHEDTTYTSIQEAVEPRRRNADRGPRQNRNVRARTTPTHRQGGNRTRARRDRGRPSSFRQVPTDRPDGHTDTQSSMVGGWDSSWRDQPRRAASAKGRDGVCEDSESGVSSGESLSLSHPRGADLSLSLSGGRGAGTDMSLPDCKIIANITARGDHHQLRRYFSESASKDISKPSKEIRHERDSYKDLTGRYTEKPESIPLKETHYSDISTKEAQLKEKKKEIKTKIKTDKSELKSNISVGSKVIIVEPLGVYDCINMGRRIDVQWPSEYWRERGGRTYWGTWIPSKGMDGMVVHKWYPNHRDPVFRSHVDKNILLVQIEDRFVPIAENCVQDLGDEV